MVLTPAASERHGTELSHISGRRNTKGNNKIKQLLKQRELGHVSTDNEWVEHTSRETREQVLARDRKSPLGLPPDRAER